MCTQHIAEHTQHTHAFSPLPSLSLPPPLSLPSSLSLHLPLSLSFFLPPSLPLPSLPLPPFPSLPLPLSPACQSSMRTRGGSAKAVLFRAMLRSMTSLSAGTQSDNVIAYTYGYICMPPIRMDTYASIRIHMDTV